MLNLVKSTSFSEASRYAALSSLQVFCRELSQHRYAARLKMPKSKALNLNGIRQALRLL